MSNRLMQWIRDPNADWQDRIFGFFFGPTMWISDSFGDWTSRSRGAALCIALTKIVLGIILYPITLAWALIGMGPMCILMCIAWAYEESHKDA